MGGGAFADLRILGGGDSVCRFKDSGQGILGGGAFADLRILGRDDGWTSVCRFKDSQRGMWGEERLQI